MRQSISPLKAISYTAVTLVLFLVLSIVAIVTYPEYAYQKVELKSNDFKAAVYSDKVNRGNSVVDKLVELNSDGFECTIKIGYDYPYCIAQYKISDSFYSGVDLSDFDEIKIYGYYSAPSDNDFLRVSLLNYNPNYSTITQTHTNKYNTIELQARELTFPISIKLSQLAVPNWWTSNMKFKNVGTHKELDNVAFIEIGTGTGASLGDHQLRIKKIEFIQNIIPINRLYESILIVWGIIITLLISGIIIYLVSSLKKAKKKQQSLMAINEMLSVKSAELEVISQYDELTGLLNRTGLKSKMVECLDNKSFPLTVAMIDIDYFKSVNDNFGHQQGDLVLEQVGSLLRTFIKRGESAARFGGEEFILLLPKHDMAEVLERLEALRLEISRMDVHIKQNITASFGVAMAQQYSEFKKVIEIADTALYKAKQDGRNCIRVSA